MGQESDLTVKGDIDLSDYIRIVSEEGDSRKSLIAALKALIESGTATPYIQVVPISDDKGLIFTEQISVGSPSNPKESVFGGGDSYGVGLEDTTSDGTPVAGSAWHCTIANTTGTTIVSATDITEILASDSGSTTGLFGGETVGNYILVGSEYPYNGIKVKIDTIGIIEPENVFAESLLNDTPVWLDTKFMATKADYPLTQRGWTLASVVGSEHWRFGFDPTGPLPPTWDKVTLNINGTDYTKYWSRFRIGTEITTDPIIEQIKLHTSRLEINSDGNLELFDLARRRKTLLSGVGHLIENNVDSASDQTVIYDSTTDNECIVKYKTNRFADNALDTAILIQNIETGIDTSIPLVLDLSYYVNTTNTGDIEWGVDLYNAQDGFIYDGSATPHSYIEIDTISSNSYRKRRTLSIKIPVHQLTDEDTIVIKLKRDARTANTNDTLSGDVVLTNIRLTGYFWKI